MSRETAVHRALSKPVRNRILAALRDAGEPCDVHTLATALGSNKTTVRAHLTVLEEARLITSEPEQRDRPGRPRLVYRATPDADDSGGQGGYRLLSEILAGCISATASDPTHEGELAGAAWGRYLVARPRPYGTTDAATSVERVRDLMATYGFDPELDAAEPAAPRILLRRCPFIAVATKHQDVVCGLHVGLMRGALEELGAAVEVRDLLPLVEPSLCVSHLGALA